MGVTPDERAEIKLSSSRRRLKPAATGVLETVAAGFSLRRPFSRRLPYARLRGFLPPHLLQEPLPGGGVGRQVGTDALQVFQQGPGTGVARLRVVRLQALQHI